MNLESHFALQSNVEPVVGESLFSSTKDHLEDSARALILKPVLPELSWSQKFRFEINHSLSSEGEALATRTIKLFSAAYVSLGKEIDHGIQQNLTQKHGDINELERLEEQRDSFSVVPKMIVTKLMLRLNEIGINSIIDNQGYFEDQKIRSQLNAMQILYKDPDFQSLALEADRSMIIAGCGELHKEYDLIIIEFWNLMKNDVSGHKTQTEFLSNLLKFVNVFLDKGAEKFDRKIDGLNWILQSQSSFENLQDYIEQMRIEMRQELNALLRRAENLKIKTEFGIINRIQQRYMLLLAQFIGSVFINNRIKSSIKLIISQTVTNLSAIISQEKISVTKRIGKHKTILSLTEKGSVEAKDAETKLIKANSELEQLSSSPSANSKCANFLSAIEILKKINSEELAFDNKMNSFLFEYKPTFKKENLFKDFQYRFNQCPKGDPTEAFLSSVKLLDEHEISLFSLASTSVICKKMINEKRRQLDLFSEGIQAVSA